MCCYKDTTFAILHARCIPLHCLYKTFSQLSKSVASSPSTGMRFQTVKWHQQQHLTGIMSHQRDQQPLLTWQMQKIFSRKGVVKILQNVQRAAKKRNTLSRVVGGTAITEDAIVKQIKTHNEKYAPKSKVQRKCENKENNLRPSTSGVVAKSSARCKPKKTDLPAEDNSDSSDNDIADSEKCSVCNRYSPDTRNFPYIMIVKWGQCDLCKGWVHLIFCSPVRVIRRGDTFKCPSCTSKIWLKRKKKLPPVNTFWMLLKF